MRFGIILLSLVMVCSLVGSLVMQGNPAEWYSSTYPRVGPIMVALEFNNIFGAWYFIAIIILLCVNLSLCCFTRFKNLHKTHKRVLALAENPDNGQTIGTEAANSLRTFFTGKRFRRRTTNNATIFYKNYLGYYGSFIVHVSILTTFIFGGLVLYLSQEEDYSLLPGEALLMYDGTTILLDNFRIFDETGRTDYLSTLYVTGPDETEAVRHQISVNYPLTFRSYKYYQQSFGISASITAINNTSGGEDTFYLTERSFLSDDGRNGLWFETLYPGYIRDSEGAIQPLIFPAGTFGVYPDPIYRLLIADRGSMNSVFALPTEEITVGDLTFVINEPFYYPGIRVKNIPHPFPALLYFSFILMCIGFWLSFFHQPATVIVRSDSYALPDVKSSALQLEIDAVLGRTEEVQSQTTNTTEV